ncbi:MAG: GAF domain-containing protein, partial [Kangiellaceae bacterium]|nr:GAF domain-containing protein [Kangiellaceae bacterium]
MLEHLRQIIQEVNSASSTQQALSTAVNQISAALDIEVCSFFLADYINRKLLLVASHGLNPQSVGQLKLDFDQGIVGLVAQREEPINLDDASTHPNYFYVPEVNESELKAFLGVPVIHQRKVLGVLAVQQTLPRKFVETEETFLITLSAQLAGVIAGSEARASITNQSSSSH